MSTTARTNLAMPLVARLLSLCLSAPDAGSLAQIAGLADTLSDDASVPETLRAAAAEVASGVGADPDLASAEYEELFGRTVACCPYEGGYERDPFRMMREMSDVSGFYRAFGAEAVGPAAERPDHVACELEFLAFLGARRATAVGGGDLAAAETCRAAEDEFLVRHLGRWLGPFCEDVAAQATSPFFAAVAALGSAYADHELGRRGLSAAPVGRRPPRGAVEAEDMACGGCEISSRRTGRGRG